jgi:translation elongation factor EF-G
VEDFRYIEHNPQSSDLTVKKEEKSHEEEKREETPSDNSNLEEEKIEIVSDSTSANGITTLPVSDPYGPLFGQVMSAAKEAFLESFLGGEPRLVEGVYLCTCQVPLDEIGHLYDVLNRRRSDVVEEEMNYSSNLYSIKAHLPVCESFGLYSEIWRKTSGNVNPQLEFDTWRVLDIDPFYIPETEEVT